MISTCYHRLVELLFLYRSRDDVIVRRTVHLALSVLLVVIVLVAMVLKLFLSRRVRAQLQSAFSRFCGVRGVKVRVLRHEEGEDGSHGDARDVEGETQDELQQ